MRILTAFSLALATLIGASSAHAAISPQQAATKIKAAIMRSSKVADKQGKFTETLGPLVKGTKYVRTFRASNVRLVSPQVPGKFQPHFVMHIGGVVSGKVNLATEKVTISGYSMVR